MYKFAKKKKIYFTLLLIHQTEKEKKKQENKLKNRKNLHLKYYCGGGQKQVDASQTSRQTCKKKNHKKL